MKPNRLWVVTLRKKNVNVNVPPHVASAIATRAMALERKHLIILDYLAVDWQQEKARRKKVNNKI
jgi:hypothetical protein